MTISASQLRQDVYRLLDEVLRTGEPLEIERKGRRLRIVPEDTPSRLGRIQTRPDLIIGDPEDLVTIEWSGEWDESRTLTP